MAEEIDEAPAPAATDPKLDIATGIYTAWRNVHLNELPVAIFARLEAASKHLIDEIAARL